MAGTILPQAVETFVDANGKPLAGGSVYMYIPNTTTFKNTWQDPALTILNTNPIILNASGQAIIWGTGSYRQQVFDVNNNLIWDQVTEDTSSGLLGNMTDNTFAAGSGFTPGTTTTLTLTVAPGSIQNTWIYFDGVYQADNSIASLNGTTLTFNAPIPVGTQLVTVKIGSTIAVGTPGDGTVTGAKLSIGATPSPNNTNNVPTLIGIYGQNLYKVKIPILTPEMFGAVGDNSTDDTVALQALATQLRAQGGGVVIISKPHLVFTNSATAPGSTLFDLTNCSNVTFIYSSGALINATYPNGTVVGTSWIFGLNGVTGFKAINPTLTASSNIPTVSGVVHFGVNTTLGALTQTTNFNAENVNQTGGLAGLIVYPTGNASVRASGFYMTGSFSGTFYPANFQGNGDDFHGSIVTRNCGRSYFPYNVSHHEIWVDSNNGTAFDDIDITCYTNPNFRNETTDIKVHYKNYGSSSLGNSVAINFIQYDSTSRSGLMHDLHIDFDFNTSNFTGAIISINKYLAGSPGSPGGPDNTARGYNLYNLKFTGACATSGNTQNLLQLFTQANWTGEFVYDVGFDNYFLSGSNTVDMVLDGRGIATSAGALYFRNTIVGIPVSFTNIPPGVTKYDNATFNNVRQDGGVSGTWIVQSVAPGIARYTYNGSLSVATGAGTTVTMPVSDKRAGNPQVFCTPKGTICGFTVNPISASQFSIAHNAGSPVLFDIDVVIAI